METTETEPYRVDRDRVMAGLPDTGIYVRARASDDASWVSADIAWLDRDSLTRWLRSRGGENEWAESVVAILLGHDR